MKKKRNRQVTYHGHVARFKLPDALLESDALLIVEFAPERSSHYVRGASLPADFYALQKGRRDRRPLPISQVQLERNALESAHWVARVTDSEKEILTTVLRNVTFYWLYDGDVRVKAITGDRIAVIIGKSH